MLLGQRPRLTEKSRDSHEFITGLINIELISGGFKLQMQALGQI